MRISDWSSDVCSSDLPFVFTPIFWNSFLARLPERRSAPAERAHSDGIVVTADSPEAFEEELWMAFFGQLHDPHRSACWTRRPTVRSSRDRKSTRLNSSH